MRHRITILTIIVFILFYSAACTNKVNINVVKDKTNKENISEPGQSESIKAEEYVRDGNAEKIINEVKYEMECKEWKDIKVVKGLVDTQEWGGLILEPDEEGKDRCIYTVLGKVDGMYNNPIHVVVEIFFEENNLDGKVYKIFYVSEAGRYADAYDFENIDDKDILAADDETLWDLMYSY